MPGIREVQLGACNVVTQHCRKSGESMRPHFLIQVFQHPVAFEGVDAALGRFEEHAAETTRMLAVTAHIGDGDAGQQVGGTHLKW